MNVWRWRRQWMHTHDDERASKDLEPRVVELDLRLAENGLLVVLVVLSINVIGKLARAGEDELLALEEHVMLVRATAEVVRDLHDVARQCAGAPGTGMARERTHLEV